MEPQSAAATVITAIQLTGNIENHCMAYMQNAHGARNEIINLINKIRALQDILDDVHEALQSDDRKALPNFPLLVNNITGCHSDLEALKVRLDPVTTQRPMKLLGAGALEWSLGTTELSNATQNLDKYKSSFLSLLEEATMKSTVERDTIKKSAREDLTQNVKTTKTPTSQGRAASIFQHQSNHHHHRTQIWSEEEQAKSIKAPIIPVTKDHKANQMRASSTKRQLSANNSNAHHDLLHKDTLQAASWEGDKEVVQLLLDAGADVNAQGGPYGNALQAASQRRHKEVVKLLLDAGADVNAPGGPYGNALQAASLGDEEVVQLLLDAGADVNAQGGPYGNALLAASWGGNKEVVQPLLDAGADVNAQGGSYGNALLAASQRGDKEVVQLLLDAGADVNAPGGPYGNALQTASLGDEEVVQLLLDAGADVYAQGPYQNALLDASSEGHKEVVQLLLDAGANVNAQGGPYGNALQVASQRGDKEVVQLLLDAGADVNAQGGPYGNALQAASQRGDKEVVQLLLDAGADVNAQGGPYGNALQAASQRRHKEVVKLLLDARADANTQGGQYGDVGANGFLVPNKLGTLEKQANIHELRSTDISRRTGWSSNRYPDQKHSGFRRSPSNEPIIRRPKDEFREPTSRNGFMRMRERAVMDPVPPLRPLPIHGDSSRKLGELAELEAPNSGDLTTGHRRRNHFARPLAYFMADRRKKATTMSSHWDKIHGDPDEQEDKKRKEIKAKCDEQLSVPSPTSIETVQRTIPETQHSPSAEFRGHKLMPKPWPLVDDNLLMQDESGAWRQDARGIASPEAEWPLFESTKSMQGGSETLKEETQPLVFPVGMWPPVDDKPFMQESSGAWVQDAQTRIFPKGTWLPGGLTEIGAFVPDTDIISSRGSTSHLDMKSEHILQSRTQTPPPAESALIGSETLQKSSIDTHEEIEESKGLENASPDLRPEDSRDWLGFLDEIVEDPSSEHKHYITPDPSITQDREPNDVAEPKSLETFLDDSTEISEGSGKFAEETVTKSTGTEKKAILSAWWLRLMTFCVPPTAGFQRISYECGCGKLLYLDVKELSAGGIERFRRRLLDDVASIKAHAQGSPGSNNPQPPPQAHLNLGSSSSQRSQNVVNSEIPHHQSPPSTLVGNTQAGSTFSQNQYPQYVHLCMNAKDSTVMVYFEASSIHNDDLFFQRMREMYQTHHDEVGFRLSRAIPIFHKLSKWSPGLASVLRFFQLPSMHFFKIASGDFVRFSLVPIGMDYRPRWFKKEPPPETEVKENRYRYEPVPMDDVEISAIPLDHLLKAGHHSSSFWITRFPKKLRKPLAWPQEHNAFRVIGWGIRMNETLDWVVILPTILVILLAIGVSVIIYAAVTSDNSAAFGLGAYLVAIFTVYITYQYYAWKDSI